MSAISHRDLVAHSPSASSTTPIPVTEQHPTLGQSLRRGLPTAIVVAVMGAIAFWGYRTDWTIPSFATLTGKELAAADDWCQEHNVPESQCIECNAELVPPLKDYGWCKVHGVAQCPLEHPDVAQLATTPTIVPADLARAARALALLPRAENSSRCQLHDRRIQFTSAADVDMAGIDIAVVQTRPIVEAAAANGEVVYDQTHTAHLASRVSGAVSSVQRQVGDHVHQGEVLALIDSADIGRAKSEFTQALAEVRLKQTNVERIKPLADVGTIPGRQFRETEAALQAARIHLRSTQQTLANLGLPVKVEQLLSLDGDAIANEIQFLGLPAETTASLPAGTATSNLFPLRSPLDGVVVDCQVVPGEVVDASTMLYQVSDVSRLWLMLDVRQEDAKYVALGQQVLFRAGESRDDEQITGAVNWISTSADDQTRTVKVRVELPNADGRLRANTFGSGRIVLREEPRAIVAPNEAIHSDGCCSVVFVRDKNYLKDGAPKFFHIRKVRLGFKDDEVTEIIAGLLPGEVIAGKNSTVLEAQLLKGNLGAGCGCGKD